MEGDNSQPEPKDETGQSDEIDTPEQLPVPVKPTMGRPTSYKPEYAEIAHKLCAKCAFTDEQLADWFDVAVSTIYKWRLERPDFSEACRVGKEETDEQAARLTLQHIGGYYVEIEELDRHGNKHKLKKWIPGNAHAGMKWLAARRPKEFREQKAVSHTVDPGNAFLAFLEHLQERHRAGATQLEAQRVIDVQAEDAVLVTQSADTDKPEDTKS